MAACYNGREGFVRYLLENGWQKKINDTNKVLYSLSHKDAD